MGAMTTLLAHPERDEIRIASVLHALAVAVTRLLPLPPTPVAPAGALSTTHPAWALVLATPRT